MELRAGGATVYQFEGGEPFPFTPEPIKEAMMQCARGEPDALRSIIRHPGIARRDCREGARAQPHQRA